MNANDIQVGGSHYRSEYQHWDFVGRCLKGRYLEGQITKYIARHHKKNGLEDVQKARHYAVKLLEEKKGRRVQAIFDGDVTHLLSDGGVQDFVMANNLSQLDAEIMRQVSMWSCVHDIRIILQLIDGVAMGVYGEEPGKGYIEQG